MKNFILLMLLFVGFVVCSAAPPPNDTVTTIDVVKQDGTVSAAKSFIQDWVPGKHTDLVVSVDNLGAKESYLYASLSPAPQSEPPTVAVEEDTGEPLFIEADSFVDWIKTNWQVLLIAIVPLLEIVVRLTPSEKDNTILSRLLAFLGKIVPNLKKGGGTHVATPN